VIKGPFFVNGKTKLETRSVCLHSLHEYLSLYFELQNVYPRGANALIELSGIDPNRPVLPRSWGPVMAMFNGDDNLKLQESYGSLRACKNTEKRGQAIEPHKLGEGTTFLTYCQATGFSPLSRLVDIVMETHHQLCEEKKETWTYDPSKKTYICFEITRNKLLSQAAKGGRDRNIRDTDSSATGRAALLSQELSYQPAESRLVAHFLHRLAYPQWYTCLTVAQRLPSALGGLDSQDFTNPCDIWKNLTPKHRNLIKTLVGKEPMAAIAAGRTLNRARNSSFEADIDEEKERYAKGLEIVNTWNEHHREKPIRLYSWQEVKDETVAEISQRSQKSISVISGLSEKGPAWNPRAITISAYQQFVRLDWFDNSFLHVPFICQVAEGTARQRPLPDPLRAADRTMRRIERCKLVVDEKESEPPEGETPFQWLRSATHAREGRQFISQSDFELISPPRKFNLRLLPGVASGIHSLSITKVEDRRYGRSFSLIKDSRVDGSRTVVQGLSSSYEDLLKGKVPTGEDSLLTSVVDELNDSLGSDD